jgi:hypothetical protein
MPEHLLLALRFDTELFSTTAASSSRPAGLLEGVTPLPAASAGSEALSADIGALVGGLSSAGGGTDVVFIAAPKQAATLKLRAGAQFNYQVLASVGLSAGSIVAVEAGGVVFGFDPVAQFEPSSNSALHMEDTSPAALVTGAGTVAAPIRSLFQTDSTALRMILHVSWGVRAAGLVQVINNVNW